MLFKNDLHTVELGSTIILDGRALQGWTYELRFDLCGGQPDGWLHCTAGQFDQQQFMMLAAVMGAHGVRTICSCANSICEPNSYCGPNGWVADIPVGHATLCVPLDVRYEGTQITRD